MSLRLEVTKEAESQVRELIKSQGPGTAVRVFVQPASGGGCGCGEAGCGSAEGPAQQSFGMAFDRPRGNDEVVRVDGFSIVADPDTAEQLDGAQIDFVRGLEATGFKITAPGRGADDAPIGSGCGCGSGGGCC